VDFAHPRVRDSDTLLQLAHTPSSLTIYGAGVIGCEYASIMASLGTKVNLVDSRDRLLSYLDDDCLRFRVFDGEITLSFEQK
jgi:NAD(P) transhydrogenase